MSDYMERFPGEMMRGVSYEPTNFDVMKGMEGVSGQIYEMHDHMEVGMREIIKRVDVAMRKSRRSLWSQELVCLDDGSLVVSNKFDDGSREEDDFVLNARGPVQVYKVVPISAENDIFFAITFEIFVKVIIGRYSKFSPSYLYELFVKAGIKFNPRMTVGKIKNLLFRAFAASITNTQAILRIPSNGGWYISTFNSRENFVYPTMKDLADFPVMQKSFKRNELSKDSWDVYFAEMNCIRNWKDRFLVMIYPFASILSSIFDSSKKLILNVIPMGMFPIRRCCCWFQIFNRDTLFPVNGSLPEKDFTKLLDTINDEILILDCRIYEDDTNYKKQKINQNQKKAISLFSGDIDYPKGTIAAGLITISNDVYFNDSVRNVFLSGESIQKLEIQEKYINNCISAVFGEFVSYVENNYSSIHHVIHKVHHHKRIQTEILEKTLEILQMFGEYEGIDFLRMLSLHSDFDVERALEMDLIGSETIVEKFVHAVRTEAVNYIFSEKKEAKSLNDVIIYDDEWLWVSPCQMKAILMNHGLGKYTNEILYHLKNGKKLKTDNDGSLSRRLQCGKVRQERYQFSRCLFDDTGCTSIVLMGKE